MIGIWCIHYRSDIYRMDSSIYVYKHKILYVYSGESITELVIYICNIYISVCAVLYNTGQELGQELLRRLQDTHAY